MAGQPTVAANAPVANPLEMMAQGYSPQTAVAAQRSQYLANALASMRDQGQNIRTPVALGANLLAEALYQRRYGQSMQDFAKAAQADQGQIDAPLIQALHSLSGGGQAPSQPSAPAAAPSAAPTSLTPDASTPPPPPTPQNTVPAPQAAGFSPLVMRAIVTEAGLDPAGQRAVASAILKRAAESNLTPDQVVQVGGFEGLTRSPINRDPKLPQYMAAAAQNVQGVQPGAFDAFYSPKGQAALGRQPPSWAQGAPVAQVGGQNFYQTDWRAPAGMTPDRSQTPRGQPTYAPQGQPGPVQIATNPQSTPTQPPSPSPGAVQSAPGGPASAPPAASPAGGASAPPFSNQPYIDPRRAAYIEAELQSPMTRMQGRADARALIQESMGGDQWDVKTDPSTGQTIYSSKTRPGVSFAGPTQGYRPNPTASIQGDSIISYDPRDPTHPTVTATGAPTEVKPMMAPDGSGGFKTVSTPFTPEKATQIRMERMKSEAVSNWNNANDAWQAMKANALLPGGISAYALRDTFARIINPAGAVRLGTIKAIEETEGLPEQVKSFFRHLSGDGPVSAQLAQQIMDAAYPFLKAHFDTASREQSGLVSMYKKNGWDTSPVELDLGEAPTQFSVGQAGRPSINQRPGVAPFRPMPAQTGPQQPQAAGGWQVMGVSH